MENAEAKSILLTVSQYILKVSKQLNIDGNQGLIGNDLELIALVRNCQFLYDKNVPDFKDIQKKSEAWETIGNVFGVSAGEVQAKWKGMRDVFNKCNNESENGISTKTRYPYYEELKFLQPHIVQRKRASGQLIDRITSEDEGSVQDYTLKSPRGTDMSSFIEHIKSQQVLYHYQYSGSSHQKHKYLAWLQLSKKFGISVQDCLTKWRNLRERYSRERRIQQKGNTLKKWIYYDELYFLDEHVKRRKRGCYVKLYPDSPEKGNLCYLINTPSDENKDSNLEMAKKEVSMNDVEYFGMESDETSSPLYNEEIVSNDTLQIVESTSQTSNSTDEDDLFGQTIAAELKRLPCPRKKMKLKSEIYRLLYEHVCE